MKKTLLLFLGILLFQMPGYAQDVKLVSGTITDAKSGMPIPAASIVEQGTSNGTITNFDGEFSLKVPSDAVLVISYLGYASKNVAVSGKTELTITMEEEAAALDEIIVVGYVSQERAAVTSSVTSIDAEDLEGVTTSGVAGLLQGKASGVQVMTSSGRPGAAASINIRGISSINGSAEPLWVLDGVILHSAPNLNPNSIASISVLKDASATALYGSRGANGVVVVTTKSGKAGKTTLSVSAKTGFTEFNNGNFELMNSQQLYDYYQAFGNPERIPSNITKDVLGTDFNWIENGTQMGVVQDYDISLSGGGEKTTTYLSVGYFNETGTIKDYEYEQLNLRLNLDYDVTEKLTLKPKIAVSYSSDYNQEGSRFDMNTYLPWDSPYAEDGSLINPRDYSGTWYGRNQRNYLYDLQWNYGESNILNLYGNMDFEYEITPELTFISTNSITLYYSDGFNYTDPRSTSGEAEQGIISQSNAKRITRFTNQMLRYQDNFGDHSLSALIAYEYNDYMYESTGAIGTGIIPGSEILDVTANPKEVSGTKNEYALQSILSNVNYSFDNRYLAQLSVRYDGASNFGKENKYGTFFSLSGGWNMHNEDFFNIEAVDQLKLRASYGSVGNRPQDLYPQYGLYSISSSYTGVPAAIPSQLGNPDLSWEKSFQTNFGIDARVFDRFNLTLEYYVKNTSDLLYFVALPAITGYTGYWENIGGFRGTGFEAKVGADIFDAQSEFSWNVNFNIGFYSNEVTELFEGQEIDRGYKITRIGKDFNSWYMRKWLGVNPENGSPLWEVVDPVTGERTQTSNYNEATDQIVGTSTPDFYGGLGSNMSYKNFNLGLNFSFVSGGEILNLSRQLYDADGAYPTFNQQVLMDDWSRWEKPGDIATHPLPLYGGNNNSNKPSSRYLEDGSYLRLRNVRLGYNFEDKLVGALGLSQLELYVSGDNLLTFTKFSGTDPEADEDGNAIYNNSYPVPKRFVIGLNVSF